MNSNELAAPAAKSVAQTRHKKREKKRKREFIPILNVLIDSPNAGQVHKVMLGLLH